MQLKRQLTSFNMQGKESVAMYMTHARKQQFELAAEEVQVTDSDLIMTILQGLPPDYDTIETIIVSTEQLPPFNTVLNRLSRVGQM